MDDMWKRLLAVLALGLLLPQLMLHIGSKQAVAQGSAQTQPPTTVPRPSQEPGTGLTVPVLMSESLVVQMDLEDYIRGVVLAEMPAAFDMEALKAQAVAARTYALRRITLEDRHPLGAVCADSTCCQAWISDSDYLKTMGERIHVKKVAAAVEQTAGLVVTYQGALAETTYFNCSGGKTESALAVWNSEVPYLQSVDSPGEEWASVFSQELEFTPAEFAACLGRTLKGSPQTWFGRERRTEGGGISTLVIGGITYSGTQLRQLLGLPSTAFRVTATGERITILAWGHGHRVGLSQHGAGAMAERGSDFREILAHYYPGTDIDKWERMG